jgi:hypothetical protein
MMVNEVSCHGIRAESWIARARKRETCVFNRRSMDASLFFSLSDSPLDVYFW